MNTRNQRAAQNAETQPAYNREMRPMNPQVRGNAALGAEPTSHYQGQPQTQYVDQPGIYEQRGAQMNTAPPPPTHPNQGAMGAQAQPTTTSTVAAPSTHGFGSGQGKVVMGKLQQVAGMALNNDEMRARGLQRESQGVARVQEREAEKMERGAAARRAEGGNIDPAGAAPMNYTNPRV